MTTMVSTLHRDSSQPLEDGESEADKRISEYEKTSLKPYVEYFQKFVNNLLKDELKDSGKRGRDDDTLEF